MGDRKTSYFRGIENARGIWNEIQDEVAAIASNFFKELFSSSKLTEFDALLNVVEKCVSREMN